MSELPSPINGSKVPSSPGIYLCVMQSNGEPSQYVSCCRWEQGEDGVYFWSVWTEAFDPPEWDRVEFQNCRVVDWCEPATVMKVLFPHATQEPSAAAVDVLHERERQKSVEGWRPTEDDRYTDRELAQAAHCYVGWAGLSERDRQPDMAKINGRVIDGVPCSWPIGWAHHWWKPTTARRDLVKAGALILAEIERLDRAAALVGEAAP